MNFAKIIRQGQYDMIQCDIFTYAQTHKVAS